VQKSVGDFSVVYTFKQAKKSSMLVMVLIVSVIDHGSDTSDHVALPSRQEELYLGMSKERILSHVQERFPFNEKRRHPVGVAGIDLPRKLEKGVDLTRL
jgi:hypothetical protein